MPRTDADDPWEYIFPSRCYALAGLQLHLCVRRSPHVASALKPASGTSLMYSASRRGENRPRKAAGCVCRRVDTPHPAAGAGMSLALACELRIAGQSARFVTAFANIGFSGDFGGSYFLSKLVGTGKARELYYTG